MEKAAVPAPVTRDKDVSQQGQGPEEAFVQELPPDYDREMDIEIGSYLNGYAARYGFLDFVLRALTSLHQSYRNREWQRRRAVVTRNIISFALLGEEYVVDEIPLAEIDSIDDMVDSTRPAGGSTLSLEDMEKARVFKYALQIVTNKLGHNAGRTYFLQAKARLTQKFGSDPMNSSRMRKYDLCSRLAGGFRRRMPQAGLGAALPCAGCPRKGRGQNALPEEPGSHSTGSPSLPPSLSLPLHPSVRLSVCPSFPPSVPPSPSPSLLPSVPPPSVRPFLPPSVPLFLPPSLPPSPPPPPPSPPNECAVTRAPAAWHTTAALYPLLPPDTLQSTSDHAMS